MDVVNIYNNQTYENIQQRKMERVPADRDKGQGSIIWDATSTDSVEQAQMYIEILRILRLTMAESSFGEYLRMRVAELGVYPNHATFAERLGVMQGAGGVPFDIPIGTRFSIEALHYVVTERKGTGQFILKCETAGIVGNQLFGRLIPVENIRGLVRADLTNILVAGADEENDDSLYARYEEKINSTPFAGNVDDYVQKTKDIDGVGGCEVYPVRRGGGTGDIVIIDSLFNVPSQVLIDRVQATIDPMPHQTGLGTAGLDHNILILGVGAATINIDARIIASANSYLGQLREDIRAAIDAYFLRLRQSWERRDRITPKVPIVIRTTQIMSIILNVEGVEDVSGVLINGQDANLTIGLDEVPFAGVVNLYE